MYNVICEDTESTAIALHLINRDGTDQESVFQMRQIICWYVTINNYCMMRDILVATVN